MIDEKTCSNCKQTKLIKLFSKNKSELDGYQRWCKSCFKLHQQTEGKNARNHAIKKYNTTEKGKITRRKAVQRYRRTLKGKLIRRKNQSIRQTRQTDAGGSHTTLQWYKLCEYYDFRCLRCGKRLPFEKLTFDHIKPISKGGSSNISNAQPLCGICNSRKKDKEIDYRKSIPDWINRENDIWIQDTLF
jgi:5-methylcytosine-specific restriction endonuclease McrA